MNLDSTYADNRLNNTSLLINLKNGIASHDTFGKVFPAIDTEHFSTCFSQWVADLETLSIIAIDGKAVQRSIDRASNKAAIHMLSAWAQSNSLISGQVKVGEKSNEITAIPKLLTRLDVAGAVITIDAMGCPKKITQQIIEQQGDYVLSLKGNQGELYDDVRTHFTMSQESNSHSSDDDAGHGRIERRTVEASDEIERLKKRHPERVGLRSVVAVTAIRELKDKAEKQTRYFISSLDASDPACLAHAVRAHWSVENNLHRVLDMSFDEDRNRAREGHSAANLSIIRHITLNLIKNEKSSKVGVKTKRAKAGWDNQYLLKRQFKIGCRNKHLARFVVDIVSQRDLRTGSGAERLEEVILRDNGTIKVVAPAERGATANHDDPTATRQPSNDLRGNRAADNDTRLYRLKESTMYSTHFLLLLVAASLVVGLIGFKRTVWFISLAYTASIAAFAVLLAWLYAPELGILSWLQLLLTLGWAFRLGGFLVKRERNQHYNAAVSDQTGRSNAMPLVGKIGIWIAVALLYTCMFSPQVFIAAQAGAGDVSMMQLLGVIIMASGLIIEAIADHQKSAAKAEQPDRFVQSGLFGWVRCPNYFGEMLFWAGNFVSALLVYSGWQWAIALVGWFCIEMIMIGSTKRMERKHEERYANTDGYADYVSRVPGDTPAGNRRAVNRDVSRTPQATPKASGMRQSGKVKDRDRDLAVVGRVVRADFELAGDDGRHAAGVALLVAGDFRL
ncbi:unnamed protein product [Cyprideis torosa]|uniref:Transposase IS4-like domain-containing protein n=1 Tax=Cyprideis torosa TaxID=163714 RepID=A0A7R8ZW20_9CRUS|nr:unnamed protein product [Cyprideis torosa]CAG0904017.1 unnamed protein product [Cyprideis torosa]